MKHKHAEILRAIADGKIVQWERGSMYGTKTGVWIDFNPDINCSPRELRGSQFNWRIKPEPKPDLIKYIGFGDFGKNLGFMTKEYSIMCQWQNRIKLTFDGETGKLKKAEVL